MKKEQSEKMRKAKLLQAQKEKEKDAWLEENRSRIIKELDNIIKELSSLAIQLQTANFLNEKQIFIGMSADHYSYLYMEEKELTAETFPEYLDHGVVKDDDDEEKVAGLFGEECIDNVICNRYMERHPELNKYRECCIESDIIDIIYYECDKYDVISAVSNHFVPEKIEELLRQNPHYKEMFLELEAKEHAKKVLMETLTGKIPEEPAGLFPLARNIQRKVFLHIGPTNSGKTHDAVERLKNADRGIYFAPLRLMAYEIYERLNRDGIPCIMETGEEYKYTENAAHFAKTIELFDPVSEYDVAVIDEAQMIADPKRGGAWTNAVLGVCAREVHICMSPDAEIRIREILADCHDAVEIIRHERKTSLVVEDDAFKFPASIQKGDALIVFSRKNVIACAADLQKKGYRCSVIYGALPYEVRQNEVNRFLTGETDIVVSTDVIGMGMNLPVRRIVFLETKKYDGQNVRSLTISEIKQIAGRAGRFGLHDTGYCTSEFERTFIREGVNSVYSPLSEAVLDFPSFAILTEGKVSDIMEQWNSLEVKTGYKKADISEILFLVLVMERLTDDKNDVYSFATIPFDIQNTDLFHLWGTLVKRAVHKEDLQIAGYIADTEYIKNSLEELENLYKRYDLLFQFARRMNDTDTMERLMEEKGKVSEFITDLLKKKNFKGKKCRHCGSSLPWNYPYGMCNRCSRNQIQYWDEDEDEEWC